MLHCTWWCKTHSHLPTRSMIIQIILSISLRKLQESGKYRFASKDDDWRCKICLFSSTFACWFAFLLLSFFTFNSSQVNCFWPRVDRRQSKPLISTLPSPQPHLLYNFLFISSKQVINFHGWPRLSADFFHILKLTSSHQVALLLIHFLATWLRAPLLRLSGIHLFIVVFRCIRWKVIKGWLKDERKGETKLPDMNGLHPLASVNVVDNLTKAI